ncbi:hypothetical protein F5B17DRAFT_427876 [Nemania serpens]|nr:hypothetical protein F5B17DRAFT_427876 [Nemania serpens]
MAIVSKRALDTEYQLPKGIILDLITPKPESYDVLFVDQGENDLRALPTPKDIDETEPKS